MGEKRPSTLGDAEKSLSNASVDSQRAPMLSPSRGHKDYNRFKYYSALRTGWGDIKLWTTKLPNKEVEC